MATLTDPRQWLLGLGMMAADMRSGLSREERIAALALLAAGDVPGRWRTRIDAYLEQRRVQREQHDLGEGTDDAAAD